MQYSGTLSAKEIANKRRIGFALKGILWAWISGVTTVIMGNINTIIGDGVQLSIEKTAIVFMIVAYAILAMNDITAGVFNMIKNLLEGRSLKEYARAARTKVGGQMMLASFFGGACATGCVMTAYNFAGLTYTGIFISTSPIITAILGRIIFKETINARMYIGIIIAVIGVCLAGFSPPTGEEYPLFLLGILLAGIAPIFFTIEGMLSTYSSDLLDPNIGCSLFRGIGSGIMVFITGLIISFIAGFGFLPFVVVKIIVTNPVLLGWLMLMGFASLFSYLGTYVAFNMTGPTRCLAVVNTLPIWTIPVGLIFSAIGVSTYIVTSQAVLGAFVVVIGILLVVAKPKELINLRDII